MLVYALDIGGSSVKHAVIDTDERLGTFVKAYEPLQLRSRAFDELKALVIDASRRALMTYPDAKAVAISTAGSVDERGVVLSAGNFNGYTNVSWDAVLRSAYEQTPPVVTVNDGRAATWSEFMGQNETEEVKDFAHFVVGTGIGGATIVDKQFVTGRGFAGQLGHLRVTEQHTVTCSCGKTGCVETMASASAIVRYYQAHQSQRGSKEVISLQEVVSAARAGNNAGLEAFQVAGKYLGIAVSHVMNLQNPNVITIGGGVLLAAGEVAQEEDRNCFFEALVASATANAHRRVVATTAICKARFGNDGGLIGAALLARSALENA